MATVTFDNATRIYPGTERPAVDSLNIDIADGEFLVLVGPSGCGKSTSLRMLAGLEDVDAGSIWVGDRDVTNVQPKDRDIAMVFQSYALYPHMTVADNMGFALKIAKVDKAEIRQRVEAAAKILDLTEYLDRKPKALSGGQRQRVAMGRAIVRQPQVFLMDEPLSNLDAKLRVQTRTQIAALQRRLGTTTVYVTHDQVEALTMGDRIAVLKDGVLQQVGTPRDMYDAPSNVFVAGFIGSPAMNLGTYQVFDGFAQVGRGRIQLTREASPRSRPKTRTPWCSASVPSRSTVPRRTPRVPSRSRSTSSRSSAPTRTSTARCRTSSASPRRSTSRQATRRWLCASTPATSPRRATPSGSRSARASSTPSRPPRASASPRTPLSPRRPSTCKSLFTEGGPAKAGPPLVLPTVPAAERDHLPPPARRSAPQR